VKARCSALSEMSSDIHAIVKGTILPPMDDTMYNGARCEKGPMTGVTASKVNTTMAIMLENRMIGHRRPRNGPSEIQTQVKEYTAVKALPSVGYSFCQVASASDYAICSE
jgi:hypothetical protein